jgi:hypothetical protein
VKCACPALPQPLLPRDPFFAAFPFFFFFLNPFSLFPRFSVTYSHVTPIPLLFSEPVFPVSAFFRDLFPRHSHPPAFF